jgi:hypothetical protein
MVLRRRHGPDHRYRRVDEELFAKEARGLGSDPGSEKERLTDQDVEDDGPLRDVVDPHRRQRRDVDRLPPRVPHRLVVEQDEAVLPTSRATMGLHELVGRVGPPLGDVRDCEPR